MTVKSTPVDFCDAQLRKWRSDDRDIEMLTQQMITSKGNNTTEATGSYNSPFKFSGDIVNKSGMAIPGVQVTFLSTEGTALVMQDTTDAAGKFLFELPDIYDS